MEWPSKRVAQGGVFNPPRVNYSPETKKFLQELMAESKLSMSLRQKINYSLRSGSPLPSLTKPQTLKNKPPEIVVSSGSSHRRQFSSIVESGAYEREKYVPVQKGMDREFAKKHLQDFMAYGKIMTDKPPVKKTSTENENISNRFDEIKQEIQERIDWLDEMEKLGEGHKYKILMQQQIAARIREMEKLQLSQTKTE